MHSDEIVIYQSKIKIVLLFIGSVFFVCLGIFLFLVSDNEDIFIKIVSVICIIFFSIGIPVSFIKFFDKKPGIVINKNGIIDYSSRNSIGIIKWDDIEGFEVVKVSSQKFLSIILNNPYEYINKFKSIHRSLALFNYKNYNSPLQLNTNTLNIRFNEFTKLVIDFYDNVQQN